MYITWEIHVADHTGLQSIAHAFEHFELREMHLTSLQRLRSHVNSTKLVKLSNKSITQITEWNRFFAICNVQMHVQSTCAYKDVVRQKPEKSCCSFKCHDNL